MATGKYICISGGEGSGKTTLVRSLQADAVFATSEFVREPGGTVGAEQIRQTLFDTRLGLDDPLTELCLLMAARRDLVVKVVAPALKAGRTVVSDRCWIDTVVYQGMVKLGLREPQPIVEVVKFLQLPFPDVWIFLDIDPEVAIKRKLQLPGTNRFDHESMDFHQRAAEGFRRMLSYAPIHPIRVDANQKPIDIVTTVRAIIQAA